MKCPHCGKAISQKLIAADLGSRGKGKAKARTSEQARAAVNKRWIAFRELQKEKQQEIDNLEKSFKTKRLSPDQREAIQRRLCELKGEDFDAPDDDRD